MPQKTRLVTSASIFLLCLIGLQVTQGRLTVTQLVQSQGRIIANPEKLNVKNGQIAKGNSTLFLVGCCYDGENRPYPNTDFWTYATAAARTIKAYGFNCIRLTGCFYSLVEISQSPYEFEYNETYIQEIVKTVNAFSDQGIYVIIDLHKGPQSGDPQSLAKFLPWSGNGDDFNDAFFSDTGPYSAREHLLRVWLKLSDLFQDNPYVAGYDLLTEPHHMGNLSSQATGDLWLSMSEYVTAGLRAKGDNHIVFLQPAPWETFRFLNRKPADPNTICDVHFYRGLDTKVFPPHVQNNSIDYIREQIATGWTYCNKLVQLNIPFIVGEYANMFYTGGNISSGSPEETYLRNVLMAFHECPNLCGHFHYTYEAYGPNQTGTGNGWQEIAMQATQHNE